MVSESLRSQSSRKDSLGPVNVNSPILLGSTGTTRVLRPPYEDGCKVCSALLAIAIDVLTALCGILRSRAPAHFAWQRAAERIAMTATAGPFYLDLSLFVDTVGYDVLRVPTAVDCQVGRVSKLNLLASPV